MAGDIIKCLQILPQNHHHWKKRFMQFESILKSSLNDHAPVQTKLMPLQNPIPWFIEEVKILKQAM